LGIGVPGYALDGSRRSFGLYTMANDNVYDWCVSFLASVRRFHESIPVVVIPFDGHCRRVAAALPFFDATLLPESRLSEIDALVDELEPRIQPGARRTLRKLYCWLGEFDVFLYSDADVVSLRPFTDLVSTFAASPYHLAYFEANPDWVYKDFLRNRLMRSYRLSSFNTGLFFGRRGVVSTRVLEPTLREARRFRDGFTHIADQPYVNYCIDVLRLKTAHVASLAPSVAPNVWAGVPGLRRQGEDIRMADGKPLPFIHWAGLSLQETLPCGEVFRESHRSALRRLSGPAPFGMPAALPSEADTVVA
jgi:hypothetical protein